MYKYIPFILGGVMFLLGLYMVLFPAQATKKELRDNPEAVKKNKKSGFVVILCGIVLAVVGII